MNKHRFNLTLPMFPKTKLGKLESLSGIEMDGHELHGVTDLCLRAGTNGFTNVVIEMRASVAAKLAGALVVNLEETDITEDLNLAGVYKRSMDEALAITGEVDMETSLELQSQLVKQIIINSIETLSSSSED